MGKKTGFIDYPRTNFSYLPVQARLKNFKEFTKIQPKTEVQNQAARCMDCGTPYCSWACPVKIIRCPNSTILFIGDYGKKLTKTLLLQIIFQNLQVQNLSFSLRTVFIES